jgi:hypothetical protein
VEIEWEIDLLKKNGLLDFLQPIDIIMAGVTGLNSRHLHDRLKLNTIISKKPICSAT